MLDTSIHICNNTSIVTKQGEDMTKSSIYYFMQLYLEKYGVEELNTTLNDFLNDMHINLQVRRVQKRLSSYDFADINLQQVVTTE